MADKVKKTIVVWETSGNEPIDKWFKSKGKHKLGFTKNA